MGSVGQECGLSCLVCGTQHGDPWVACASLKILPHSLYGQSPGDYALESCSLAGGRGVGGRNLLKFCLAVPCITQATLELPVKAQIQRASLGT